MTLHIFNPEHDLALASAKANFTAPHAGRQLRHDLAWLPSLWAQKGDTILVDDVRLSKSALAKRHWLKQKQVDFVCWKELAQVSPDHIAPWGWDAALRQRLLRGGMAEHLLPNSKQIDDIRQLSHRRTAMALLQLLKVDLPATVGEQHECTTIEDVLAKAEGYEKVVLKAPWSSSGRGVRFCTIGDLTANAEMNILGWLRNILDRQGSVMVEPYYHKVKDFGMEFHCDEQGQVTYLGLSLFHTQNGAYTGNILATENAKRKMMSHYIPDSLLEKTKDMICHHSSMLLGGKYQGPFGIDMMVSGNSSTLALHPCVEINLRRTMGHAALALADMVNPQHDDDLRHVMRIDYEGNNYKLRLRKI